MIPRKIHLFLILGIFLLPIFVFGQQEVKIEFEKKNVLVSEVFSIKVIIKNSDKWEVKNFPDIPGCTKTGTVVSHANGVSNGQKIAIHSFTQNYIANKEGSYKIQPFYLDVNGEDVRSEPFVLNILKNQENEEEQEPQPILSTISGKGDAFLALSMDKKQIFVGEGFKVSIGLYVSETNTAEMKFPDDLETQLMAISKKIQSSDCLEDRLPILEIKSVPTVLKGKKYQFFKIFEAIYYPLSTKTIVFPAVTLRMLIIKSNKHTDTRAFGTDALYIKPIELPEHPLKSKVLVGNFRLIEKIISTNVQTSKSFDYSFIIAGEGNFSAVNMPPMINDSYFDFYPPEIKTKKEQGKMLGEKEFKYHIVPKEAGERALEKYFYWVFFNAKKGQYDTLHSKLKIKVSGQKIAEKTTQTSNDIYEGIDKLETTSVTTNYREVVKNIENLLIIFMFAATVFLIFFKRKNRET